MAENMVTGGMGFFGLYLARELLADGESVVLFQRRRELPPSAADLKGKVEIFSSDISNPIHLLEAAKKYNVNCIYHAAALLSKDCDESAIAGFKVNVVGTMNVLEASPYSWHKRHYLCQFWSYLWYRNPPQEGLQRYPSENRKHVQYYQGML